jgi:hypothetical protein
MKTYILVVAAVALLSGFHVASAQSSPPNSPPRNPTLSAWIATRARSTDSAKNDPQLKAAMTEAAAEADELPHHWSTISNEAAFGTDYFTRTAVAKSNIFVNSPNETKYFYQDLDASGARLNGAIRYTVTFAKGQTPRCMASGP